MVAPRALVFRPLVKGHEDSGNEIVQLVKDISVTDSLEAAWPKAVRS